MLWCLPLFAPFSVTQWDLSGLIILISVTEALCLDLPLAGREVLVFCGVLLLFIINHHHQAWAGI